MTIYDDHVALVDAIGRQVVQIFATAETVLLERIAYRLANELPENPTYAVQAAVLAQLQADAQQIADQLTPEMADAIVERATRVGAASMAETLTGAEGLRPVAGIGASTVIGAALIATDFRNAFSDVRRRILRYPTDAMDRFRADGDIYSQVIARNAPNALLGVMSTDEARKAALREFLALGITGFVDKRGREWRIGTYTEMATRTAVSRAFRQASEYRARDAGVEFFTIMGGSNACQACARWFGKIIATSGRSGTRYVLHAYEDREIAVEVAGTILDWYESKAGHPNCQCSFASYLPGLRLPRQGTHYDPEAEKARNESRRLERAVRQAKRERDLAIATGAPSGAHGTRIRTLQAELRAHTAATGQRRRYNREQVEFAS